MEEIVRTDAKSRYSFSADGQLIRCNQGHSIPVDVELEQVLPPEFLWHGTAERFLPAIFQEGLRRMSRLYVHLSATPEIAQTVGARHGKPVVLRVQTGKMAEDGYAFYRSVNGVWLTEAVPAKYLEEMK
ncbi:RNA 2'-phosphotransferase [Ruminococcus callidus]|uniref:RNA 2'-phosphotransferase n=1 Tax=Ruminococcus callidus TaxID=40519 RepID=UPI0030B97AFA